MMIYKFMERMKLSSFLYYTLGLNSLSSPNSHQNKNYWYAKNKMTSPKLQLANMMAFQRLCVQNESFNQFIAVA